MRPLNLQLWSIYYDPVPTGIGPIATAWARSMHERGHRVSVVTSHPHYPAPAWGRRLVPYREFKDGVPVLRLPLLIGRATTAQRLVQELSFAAVQTMAAAILPTPDVLVAVSPSFPALAPAMLNAGLRGRPWVLWLQDILPDGAVSTGLLRSGRFIAASRRLEAAAYRSADRIVVISESFERNLRAKGVPRAKLERIYNPATRAVKGAGTSRPQSSGPRILSMGNIGLSQGLEAVVRTFENCDQLKTMDARLVIVGHGVATPDVKSAITADSVEMLGLVSDDRLQEELQGAALGLVTQRAGIAEFNLPSKLMTFMGCGLPVVASVDPRSETARLVQHAGAGWIADSANPSELCAKLVEALRDPHEIAKRGDAALQFACQNFTPTVMAERFEPLLEAVVGNRRRRRD